MAVATFEDVAVELGRPISTEAEQEQVEWWLSGAELIIWSRLGDLSALNQDVLKLVEVNTVAAKVRRLTNGGASSVTVGIDDGNVTTRFENAMDANDFTDTWWSMLGWRRKAVSMRVGGGEMLR